MADNVTFTLNADSTPPANTVAATDELSDGSHAGLAKLLVSADGDRTPIPATAADGLLVDISNASIPVTGGLTDAQLRATPVPVDIDAPLGQAAMAASVPVVVASNQTDVPISAASLPLPSGAATLAEQQTQTTILSVLDDWDETNRAAVNLIAGQVGVQGGIGDVTALTQRVVEARADTGAQTSVADNAASVTLLASNANRVKAIISNDSSARLYILFNGSAASTTAYGVSLAQYESWEELNYTGEIRGIWASDPGDGAARITEFT